MTRLPRGKYTMVNASVRLSYGGATRAQLLRARLFAQETNEEVEIVTFDVYPEYEQERRLLSQEGLITPGVKLSNLHEELASAPDLSKFSTDVGNNVPDWYQQLSGLEYVTEYTQSGLPYRRKYDPTGGNRSFIFSYLRADGTVYAIIDRRVGGTDWDRQERGTLLIDPNGKPIGFYPRKTGLIARWLQILGEGEPQHFLIFDSKESGHVIAEESRVANQFFVLMAHTPHLQPPRNWDSPPASAEWGETIKGLNLWDAFVVLSEAHKRDIELRYGKRNNIFVLPHPAVDIASKEDAPKRDPELALIVCRLEHVKRLQDAIHAFAKVLEIRPNAKLEIYGTGSKLSEWQSLANDLGIAASVKFMGYDPRPERHYSRASVFIMTSLFEAQPLTLLEALAHGCPIAAYDIKYGPREMIKNGFNGYLSPDGDIDHLADSISKVLGSGSVSQMSDASIDVATEFSVPVFIEKWSQLFECIISQKSGRLTITSSALTIDRLTTEGGVPTAIRLGQDGIDVELRTPQLTMGGRLSIASTHAAPEAPEGLNVTVRIHSRGGAVEYVPCSMERLEGEGEFDLEWTISKDYFPQTATSSSLFYEVTWNNDQQLVEISLTDGQPICLFPSGARSLVEVTA